MGDIRNDGNGWSYEGVENPYDSSLNRLMAARAVEKRIQERKATLPLWFLDHCYKVVGFYQDQNPDLVNHLGKSVFQYTDEQGTPYKEGQIICFCSETGYDDVEHYANGTWAKMWDGGEKFRVEISQEEWDSIQRKLTDSDYGRMWPDASNGYHLYRIRSHFAACALPHMAFLGGHDRCRSKGHNPRTTVYAKTRNFYRP